ncbi:hypothetical protein EC957_012130 [Mortierella hygrophila]|uniref:Uncharacterized protein n=1 Tax=Mortierella hygrophila TaxID=979708 RepID=A0A9P6F8F9_9FUNG|nr:hypothetical protein EC957_012130 [Mortierella hygrophila]
MRISFSGPAKCSLIFESLKYCPCPTCDSWTTLETHSFKGDPQRIYGIIDLEGYDQVVSFKVCWDHQMLMSLNAYPDRQTAKASDLNLFVCGWKRNTRWTDNVVFVGNLCVVTVEVFYIIGALASPPSPLFPMITFPRRSPHMLVVDHLCHDSVIKVEVNDRYYQQPEIIKVEVGDFYQPKTMLSPISASILIPGPRQHSVPEKQEIDCAQDQYTSPSSFLPLPRPPNDEFPYNQYTPPPPTVKEEKKIEWEEYPFPHSPLPPRRPIQEDATSIISKSYKHGGVI